MRELVVRSKTSAFFSGIWRNKFIYILLIPGIIWYAVFCYVPMYGILLAFKDFNLKDGIIGSPWADMHGLANYIRLFKIPQFWQVFMNTVIISFGKLLFGFPAPIILALLINEISGKLFKKFINLTVYLPYFLSWVIVSGIVFNLLSVNGFVNQFRMEAFGLEPIQFLTTSSYFRPIVYITDMWKDVGWGTIIYMAAISSISPEFYEAATIDGANRFQKVLHITWPSIVPTISILFILRVGQMMNVGFDQILNLYNSSVYDVGDIIQTYVYRKGLINSEYSLASAAGLFTSAINLTLLWVSNKLTKKVSGQSIY